MNPVYPRTIIILIWLFIFSSNIAGQRDMTEFTNPLPSLRLFEPKVLIKDSLNDIKIPFHDLYII